MKEIKMFMSFENEEATELVAYFSDDDIDILKQYCEHSERLRETTIMKSGLSSEIRLNADTDEPKVKTGRGQIDFELMASFLHQLRPIFLSEEPASFDSIAGLIGRRFSNKAMKRHLKAIRSARENSPFKGFGQMSIANVPLWDNETMKKWLYAFEYHQDKDKKEFLRDVEASLGHDAIRTVFVDQLRFQSVAYIHLEDLARFIIDF